MGILVASKNNLDISIQITAQLLRRYFENGSTHRLVRAPVGASWSDTFRILLVLVRP